MRRFERLIYRTALAELFAGAPGPLFHVTAMLPPGASREMLEDRLRAWAARIDRCYLGRNWAKPPYLNRRMRGVVFFERSPHHHAHLVVTPPEGASRLHFLLNARFWFERHREPLLRSVYPIPVADRGRMLVQLIRPTAADVARVIGYGSKEIEFRVDAIAEWKFLADLTGRQRA
jgi:hypothetical protein